jgi:5-methylthioadenosine/S-adenosylhomocysteine deaminase
MRFDEMLKRGVRLGLATDGSVSNDTQNMFEAMRLAGLWHNRNDIDYCDWPAPEAVLRAATSGSAHALGLGGETGMIERGRLADMVMLSRNSFPFVPLNDVINQIVFCENGMSVTDVMIGGRWVLRDRRLLTIDEAKLYARAQVLRDEMNVGLQEQFRRTAEIEPSLREAYLGTTKVAWSPREGA